MIEPSWMQVGGSKKKGKKEFDLPVLDPANQCTMIIRSTTKPAVDSETKLKEKDYQGEITTKDEDTGKNCYTGSRNSSNGNDVSH